MARPFEDRISLVLQLTETMKELNKARDAAENPGLSQSELERRFWRRMRAAKESRRRGVHAGGQP